LRRITAALLLGAAVLAPGARVHADSGHSASQSRAPPAQSTADELALLEFLGGIGSEDEDWIDYLASTDPAKVAAGKVAAEQKPARSEPSTSSEPPRARSAASNGSQKQ
jgi:hypothetical protein